MVVEVFAFVVSHRKGRANVVYIGVFICFALTYGDFGKNGKNALNKSEYKLSLRFAIIGRQRVRLSVASDVIADIKERL